MHHRSVYESMHVCVRVQKSFQEDLYYSLYLDNGLVPFFCVCQTCGVQAERIGLIKTAQRYEYES